MKGDAIFVCAVLVAGVAGFWDWRSRKIPNWLTLPALLSGAGVNFAFWGAPGILRSLEGAAIVLAALLPVVFLRGLGGGDWKLMGALGAWLGPQRVVIVLLVTIFISGILALIQVVLKRRLIETVRNVWELLRGFFIFGLQPHPEINLDNATALSLPFGVATALATFGCFWVALIR